MLKKIKTLCTERGISILHLEKELGMSHSIHRWDESKPSIDKVKLVADYLGVTVDYLLADEEYDENEMIKQKLFDTPGKRILFSAMDGATENDLLLAAQVIEALKSNRGK